MLQVDKLSTLALSYSPIGLGFDTCEKSEPDENCTYCLWVPKTMFCKKVPCKKF